MQHDMALQALEKPIPALTLTADPLGPVKCSPALAARRLDDLVAFIDRFFMDDLGFTTPRDTARDLTDFFAALPRNPARDAKAGATGDGPNLWLHLTVRRIQPTLCVESGTWVGRSLYTTRVAAPDAAMHAFDITFKRLKFRDPAITLHEQDFSQSDVRCAANDVGFIYFDDHINNGRRIAQAHARGFRHLVFDQCVPAGQVQLFRFPGLPTALMIARREMQPGDTLEWTWRGEHVRYTFDPAHTHGAESLIDLAVPFPSLEPWLGLPPGQGAYVRLKP
jgi:hypothetical protein